MNLIESKSIIANNLSILQYKSRYISNNLYEASDLRLLRTVLNNLSSITYIQPELETLKSSWLFNSNDDIKQIESSEDTKVSNLVSRIRTGLQFLSRVLEDNQYNNREDIVYIRLPEVDSFEDLAKVANDLKKGIEMPLLDTKEGDVDIITAESGSIWLIVSLGTMSAVNLIAGICWAAVVVRKKRAEARIFEAHAKTLELKNDSLDILIEAQKKQINNILENEAEVIANKHYSNKDNETIERLKLSISTVSDLIEKGTKILPSSSDPETLKIFPEYNSLGLIESSIRQITENKK